MDTEQLLVCADDMNLLRRNINTEKQSIEVLYFTSKKTSTEINAEKTERTVLYKGIYVKVVPITGY